MKTLLEKEDLDLLTRIVEDAKLRGREGAENSYDYWRQFNKKQMNLIQAAYYAGRDMILSTDTLDYDDLTKSIREFNLRDKDHWNITEVVDDRIIFELEKVLKTFSQV
jgi:hypothetical protein